MVSNEGLEQPSWRTVSNSGFPRYDPSPGNWQNHSVPGSNRYAPQLVTTSIPNGRRLGFNVVRACCWGPRETTALRTLVHARLAGWLHEWLGVRQHCAREREREHATAGLSRSLSAATLQGRGECPLQDGGAFEASQRRCYVGGMRVATITKCACSGGLRRGADSSKSLKSLLSGTRYDERLGGDRQRDWTVASVIFCRAVQKGCCQPNLPLLFSRPFLRSTRGPGRWVEPPSGSAQSRWLGS